MTLTDIIAIAVIAAVVGLAVMYILKERKKTVSLRYLHAHLHSMFFNIAKMWRQPTWS